MSHELLPGELDRLRESLEREQGLRREAQGAAGRAERELSERQRLLEVLHVIADAANGAATAQAAVQMALDEICALTGWPVGHAYLASEESPPVLVSAGLWHLDRPDRFARLRQSLAVARVPAPESLPGRVLATRECAWVRDLAQDDPSARGELACAAGLQGAFALPVTIGASAAGVIEFFSELPVKPEAAFLEVAAQVGAHLGRAFERQRAAEQRMKLEAQILRAQRLEGIGTLASGIAHDFNNILAPMLMCVELLQEKLAEPEDREMMLVIEAGAQRGSQMIKRLLAFDRGGEKRGPVELRALLKEMTAILRETFPREIAIVESLPGELWTVTGDSTQLHQVLLNFCVNARDAMPDGGTLSLTAENLVLPTADTALHPEAKPGPYVVLAVADTGQGIPPEILCRIFDPFFTTKAAGTGLGLSTVAGIVRDHGGFVTVSSVPGHGSLFKAHLPAVAAPNEAPPPAPAEPIAIGGGELILVVDDEPAVREVTRRTLEKHRYRVLTAGEGREALTLFMQRWNDVKLVLTDTLMPVMGGLALVRALRALNPKLKVVATSGLDEERKRAELVALGVNEFIRKPCRPQDLLAAIERQLAAT
jgi:signal transduction histidine kinase/ActR/RegA family two-component response regulator